MALLVARQDRGEVETEAVDMHLADPISQAVDDQTADDRLISVQCVAATGEIGVAGFVLRQGVIGVIRQSSKANGGAVLFAFCSVVVDDIEDDLDADAVQRLDHVAELVERAKWVCSGAVAAMGGEKQRG